MTTILVAEDSKTQRALIAGFLKNNKFNVITASNGVETLEKVFNNYPDLVLLDIIMPYINGYDICRRIKSQTSTKHIPVIFCSTKDTEVDRYWGLRQADAYIAKPFTPRDLIEAINVVLRNKPLTKQNTFRV